MPACDWVPGVTRAPRLLSPASAPPSWVCCCSWTLSRTSGQVGSELLLHNLWCQQPPSPRPFLAEGTAGGGGGGGGPVPLATVSMSGMCMLPDRWRRALLSLAQLRTASWGGMMSCHLGAASQQNSFVFGESGCGTNIGTITTHCRVLVWPMPDSAPHGVHASAEPALDGAGEAHRTVPRFTSGIL